MSQSEANGQKEVNQNPVRKVGAEPDDDEPDEWLVPSRDICGRRIDDVRDQRINKTGCASKFHAWLY
jgi:hypothetical protein